MKKLALALLLSFPAQAQIVVHNYSMKDNRLAFLMGFGPRNVQAEFTPEGALFSIEYYPTIGLSYDRRIDRNTFIGLEGLNNGTMLLRAGKEF